MKKIDIIESSFGTATSIRFFPTPNYDSEPPVVVLIFDKPRGGAESYNLLLDNYRDKHPSLAIFQNGEKVDISIIIKDMSLTPINWNKFEKQFDCF